MQLVLRLGELSCLLVDGASRPVVLVSVTFPAVIGPGAVPLVLGPLALAVAAVVLCLTSLNQWQRAPLPLVVRRHSG